MAKSFSSMGKGKGGGGKNEPSWDEDVQYVDISNGKSHRLRMVGPLTLLARRWLVSYKSGKSLPPFLSPKYSEETEAYTLDNEDVFYDYFEKPFKYAQQMMTINVIDRDAQKKNALNPVRALRMPYYGVQEQFDEIRNVIGTDNLADEQAGFDLSIRYSANDKKYLVTHIEKTPLTEEELNYEYYDFGELAPDFENDPRAAAKASKELRLAAVRNFYFVKQVVGDDELDELANPWDGFESADPDEGGRPFTDFEVLGKVPKGKFKPGTKVVSSRSSSDEEAPRTAKTRKRVQVVEDDDDFEDEAPPAKLSRPSQKAKMPVVDDLDDDDLDDVDEDLPPPPKAAKKSKKTLSKKSSVHPDVPDMAHPDFGTVPECFTDYEGTRKCKKCPVSHDCIENSDDDDDM